MGLQHRQQLEQQLLSRKQNTEHEDLHYHQEHEHIGLQDDQGKRLLYLECSRHTNIF